MSARPSVISIFSGCGGIDLGFEKAGYEILYSTDIWEPACNSLAANRVGGIVDCRDIREIDFKEILGRLQVSDVDCLVGGPPCPPYSKSRFYLKEKGRALDDEASYTLAEYFRAIEEINPRAFFFENVHGFVYKPHFEAFSYLRKRSRELGYEISYKVVNAALYGVPQIRERFICIGTRQDMPAFLFPEETHYNPDKAARKRLNGKKPWVTCGEVLRDLDYELPEDKDMVAGSRHSELLKLIPPGENYLYFTKKRNHPNPVFKWRSRYWSFLLKLSPERPSWTIQASKSNNMGPFHWRNRFLRISEIKRLQTFDDSYIITGDNRIQWRQIGNAVPPLLAKTFAESIKSQILCANAKERMHALSPRTQLKLQLD